MIDTATFRNLTTRSLNGSFYRFHKVRHFHRSPERFYKNFIETRSGFESQARFAPAHAQCAFYLALSEEIATAEMLFYAEVHDWQAVTTATAEKVLATLKAKGDDRVFLTVSLTIDSLLDLTDWRNVDALMRHGTARWKGRQLEFEVQYLAGLLSEYRGGNDLTDVLGVDAKALGFRGVVFPSVRALMYDGSRPDGVVIRQNLHDILNMSAAGNIMDLEWQGAQQLKQQWNAVIFSGNELTRCISRVEWLDSAGQHGSIENPFWNATDDALELARLRERAHRGLDPESAAKEGLLTSIEAETEFYNNTMFVRGPREKRR